MGFGERHFFSDLGSDWQEERQPRFVKVMLLKGVVDRVRWGNNLFGPEDEQVEGPREVSTCFRSPKRFFFFCCCYLTGADGLCRCPLKLEELWTDKPVSLTRLCMYLEPETVCSKKSQTTATWQNLASEEFLSKKNYRSQFANPTILSWVRCFMPERSFVYLLLYIPLPPASASRCPCPLS